MQHRDGGGPLPLGEVFPGLRRGCLVGIVVGIAVSGWCWHYLRLARAGQIPPSVRPGGGLDSPTLSYAYGVVGGAAFSILCLALLIASFYLPRVPRRRS